MRSLAQTAFAAGTRISRKISGWFDTCEISEIDRQKIGRANALRLFKLKL